MNNIAINQNNNLANQNVKSNSAKIKWQCCWSLFKLINTQYWNNPGEWFYDFIFSIIFTALFGFINQAMLQDQSGANFIDGIAFKNVLIGLISLNVISAGSFSMPSSIMEIKISILMKRIGSTPIKPWMFIITCFIYYFMITLGITLWSILWILILFGFQNFNITPANVENPIYIKGYELFFSSNQEYSSEWIGLMVSLIYMNIISIFIGLFNVSTSKTSASLNVKGSMLYFGSMLLSGMLFPLSAITNNSVLNAFSFITPYRYSNNLITISWLGGNIFDPFNSHTSLILDSIRINQTELIISFFIPIIFVIISLIATIKFFKWSTR